MYFLQIPTNAGSEPSASENLKILKTSFYQRILFPIPVDYRIAIGIHKKSAKLSSEEKKLPCL